METVDYYSRHRAELRQKIAEKQPMLDKSNAEQAEYLKEHPAATTEAALEAIHTPRDAQKGKKGVSHDQQTRTRRRRH